MSTIDTSPANVAKQKDDVIRANLAYGVLLVYANRAGLEGWDTDAIISRLLADIHLEVRLHQGDDFDNLLTEARNV
jgi:hypothetical protein